MKTPLRTHRRLLAASHLSLLAFGLVALLALPATTSAHELKTDGTIAGVLHTNPDDNPATGSPTKYIIFFADTTERFSLALCNCTVSVIGDGKTITTNPLDLSSADVGDGSYTFTAPAVYTLRFSGAPKQPGAFQPFVLDYAIHVTNSDAAPQHTSSLIWTGMGIGVVLVLLAGYATNRAADREQRVY